MSIRLLLTLLIGFLLSAIYGMIIPSTSNANAMKELRIPMTPSFFKDSYDNPRNRSCYYCHFTHSAPKGKNAMLNGRSDRYSKYLDSEFEQQGLPPFFDESPSNKGKCPRSKSRF